MMKPNTHQNPVRFSEEFVSQSRQFVQTAKQANPSGEESLFKKKLADVAKGPIRPATQPEA